MNEPGRVQGSGMGQEFGIVRGKLYMGLGWDRSMGWCNSLGSDKSLGWGRILGGDISMGRDRGLGGAGL